MSKNIKSQFNYLIDANYSPGTSKNSYREEFKEDGNSGPLDKIFGSAELRNLKDLASQFSGYIKENPIYSNIKQWKNIPESAYQDFLNSKAGCGCSKSTIGRYYQDFKKLEILGNKTFKTDIKTMDNIIKPESINGSKKIRNIEMDSSDAKDIFKAAYSTEQGKTLDAKGVVGLELTDRFGLRVTSVTKIQIQDIDLEKMIIHIEKDKGGKSRDLPIEREDISFLTKAIDKAKAENSKLLCRGLKPNSLNKYIARVEVKAGCRQKYKDSKTSCHAFRKKKAQNLYNQFRNNGDSKKDALDKVSIYLGHGKNRDALMREYVLNIW